MKEYTTHSEKIWQGKVFTVKRDDIKLENGLTSMREVVVHHGGGTVVPLTDDGCVLLVKQYRYALGEEIYEIPAGKIEEGEDPMDCASRELIEETGYRAEHIEHMISFAPTPGYDTEVIHLYKATGLKWQGQHLDPGEFLDVVKVPLDEAVEMCMTGKIKDGKTLVGILMATHK